jgi:para-aminobenzoate synthetase/4-amino-4-deoxychorismate lyase
MVAPRGAPFRARFNVAIRTAVIHRGSGHATYGVGSGITWDSDPVAEYRETILKAAVLGRPAKRFALLETMRYEPGSGVRNLDRHLARLAASADYFGFPFVEQDARAALAERTSALDRVSRVRMQLDETGRLTCECAAFVVPSNGPVRLAIDRPGPPIDIWCRHKTTRRERYTAAAARHPDADDVVLTDAAGRVIETTIANLAVRVAGRWWTPPLASGCLPGVERGRLLDAARLAERELTVADLHAAEALAVVNSLRGWRAAQLLDPRPAVDVDSEGRDQDAAGTRS